MVSHSRLSGPVTALGQGQHTLSGTASGGVLTVDLGAIEWNYRHLSSLVGGAACAGVVKADAYGLGARRVVHVLLRAGCKTFFVAQLSEALDLRDLIPETATLCVLNGVVPGAESTCAAAGIVPVLNSFEQLAAWSRHARDIGRTLPAIVQIDSGMSRLGLSPHEVEATAAAPEIFDPLDLRLVMSHLACGDEPDHPANAAQFRAFNTLRAKLPPAPASLANSAGVFLGRSYHFNLCRPGAALYGLSAGPAAYGVRPVVGVCARVAQIRVIEAGTHVGYGYSFQAGKPMRLATLAVGYADGWSRALSNAGAAWCDGVRLPIVGRVSMDSCSVDISALATNRLTSGDFVELIGANQSADAVASEAGTIGYEILTQLSRRFDRRYR